MTDPLDELRRLDAKRSRGEWTAEPRGWGDGSVTIRCGEYDDHAFAHHSPDNAEYIAACSRLVPVLLDRLEQLEAALGPFSAVARRAVEPQDDGSGLWVNGWGSERIKDWLGPTDFAHALAALPSPAEDLEE